MLVENINFESQASAWHLVVDSFIFELVTKRAIEKTLRQKRNKDFSYTIKNSKHLFSSYVLEELREK